MEPSFDTGDTRHLQCAYLWKMDLDIATCLYMLYTCYMNHGAYTMNFYSDFHMGRES